MHLKKVKKIPIPRPIWAIGIASMLMNISTAMIYGIAALYMNSIGVANGLIVRLEGLVEACAYLMKLLSGVFSDYLMRRKTIMVWGFALIALTRPMLATAASPLAAISARLLDRIGNGIQSTPRDALVSDIANPDIKGRCLGLRQSLTTVGSFIGGGLGWLIMLNTTQSYKKVFWLASIPAAMALIILIIMVKEPKKKYTKDVEIKVTNKQARHPLHLADIKRLGKAYWILMLVAAIFMMARLGEATLILHATKNYGFPESCAHSIMIIYNGTNTLVSYPVGWLSDRLDRRLLLGLGFVILIAADLLLGSATNIIVMMVGVGLWGIQIGITQSMFLALIADYVPADLRGTGFGFFYLISAVSLILAGHIGGVFSQNFNEGVAFLVSGGIGIVALVALWLTTIFVKKLDL